LTEQSTIRDEPNDLRVGQVYAGRNFGVIAVDWSQEDPAVRLEIRGEDGRVMNETSLLLGQLAPPKG